MGCGMRYGWLLPETGGFWFSKDCYGDVPASGVCL